MIISPPFLNPSKPDMKIVEDSAGNFEPPEDNICTAMMHEGTPGNGAFPVSFDLGWHGGAHLKAPTDANGKHLPVRAIADGTIVYLRQNDKTKKKELQHLGLRTDDGCVVIRHETEIGEGANANVRFYSIYMHMLGLTESLQVNQRIYRKEALGVAGQIYGQTGRIHFEIVCDTTNMTKLLGRPAGPVSKTARTDAIYGDTWFYIPSGTRLYVDSSNTPEPEPQPFWDGEKLDGTLGLKATTSSSAPPTPAHASAHTLARNNTGEKTLHAHRDSQEIRRPPISQPNGNSGHNYTLWDAAATAPRTDAKGIAITAMQYDADRWHISVSTPTGTTSSQSKAKAKSKSKSASRSSANHSTSGIKRPIQSVHTTEDLAVRMHYSGYCELTTFRKNSQGQWIEHAKAPREVNGEYNLYTRANTLNGRYQKNDLPASIQQTAPAPSAIFDILRFGRSVTDSIEQGQIFNHWRRVNTPYGNGWINLSLPRVRVYSDADLPEWDGWQFICDDTTGDSRCDSETIRTWLEDTIKKKRQGTAKTTNDPRLLNDMEAVNRMALTHDLIKQTLPNATIQTRLKKTACLFPTEWSREGLQQRYAWLKQSSEQRSRPLSDKGFEHLMEHATALAFWEEINDPAKPAINDCWHWSPTAFIKQFRKCGWLSAGELGRVYEETKYTALGKTGEQYNNIYRNEINLVFRKYGLNQRNRISHFFGQIAIETFYMMIVRESSIDVAKSIRNNHISITEEKNGHLSYLSSENANLKYFKKYENKLNLGNTHDGDGIKFRGRGFKQLTGRYNYSEYWLFRGWIKKNSYNPSWFKKK